MCKRHSETSYSGKDPRAGHTQIADPCIGVVTTSGTEGSTQGPRGCQSLCCACPSRVRVACRRARPDLPFALSARAVVSLCAEILCAPRYAWRCTTLPNGLRHPGKTRGRGRRIGRRLLLPLFLIALAGCGGSSAQSPAQREAAQEAHQIVCADDFWEPRKRECEHPALARAEEQERRRQEPAVVKAEEQEANG
jgi:hypothetical protein